MNKYSQVYLREEEKNVLVPISQDKPDITEPIKQKWQNSLNTIAKLLNVPSSLIMKIEEKEIKVFLKGQIENNPYNQGAGDTLGHGLYCETVIGRDRPLTVPNSLSSQAWKDNPDVKLNMISYLGYPLKWPDGQFFGTICVLDKKENPYTNVHKDLMNIFKEMIELDLSRELELYELKNHNAIMEYKMREIHHRIKNNFNMILSFIQLKAFEDTSKMGDIIPEISNRIKAASLLHERLYKSADFHENTQDYIQDLSNLMLNNLSTKMISLKMDIDNISIFNNLLDFGMVIIELISNSIKYAFDNTQHPVISIRLKRDNNHIIFKYHDNGTGFVDKNPDGLGTVIIEGFVQKYNGRFKKYNDNGAVYEFHIPL